MKQENKLKTFVKNFVSINVLSIWFAFMCGYLITVSNYTGAALSGAGLFFTIMLKEKYKEELSNGERKH